MRKINSRLSDIASRGVAVAFAAASLFMPSAELSAKGNKDVKDGVASSVVTPAKNNISVNQEFRVLVYENSDSNLLTFGKNINSRGILGDSWKAIKGAYRNTLTGQISSVSTDLLAAGVGLLVESMRDKKPDWIAQVKKDSRYTKSLPMQEQITDFYATTSTRGAMDLDSIVFDGFGCQQFLTYKNPGTDSVSRLLVFDLKCSMRKDKEGKDRMIHHSKFEIVVDHLYFNPYLCNLPNDSLTAGNANLRIPFSFASRRNLQFDVNAKITSSWMNEAIQVVNDQLLGEFNIRAVIPDSLSLEQGDWNHNYFVYIRPTAENIRKYGWDKEQIATMEKRGKMITVTGESFLVPRSFIGYDNTSKHQRIWGTGQYKVDMTVSESCDINYDYYLEPGPVASMASRRPGGMPDMKGRKWNGRWSEEWRKMKGRRKSKNIFRDIWNDLKMTYGNYRWVYTLVDPVTAVILTQENAALNKWTNSWLGLGNAAAAGSVNSGASAAGKGGQSQGGSPQGNAQPGGTSQNGQPQGGQQGNPPAKK